MNIQFIGQGFNPDIQTSVAQLLIENLRNPIFHTFKCLVAFASNSGIKRLSPHIIASKDHINNFRIIVGIDQQGTSLEALKALLEWDIESFVFYTTQSIIFHPKIYLFEGENEVSVIIGSSNLTKKGLAQNIESSVKIEFKKSEENGMIFYSEINSYFNSLLNGEFQNLQLLSEELIEILFKEGLLPTEQQRRAQYRKSASEDNGVEDIDNEIGNLFPTIPVSHLPADFEIRVLSVEGHPIQDEIEREILSSEFESANIQNQFGPLVWRRMRVPGSSVQYGGESTHPTGGLRLVQAGFRVNYETINQTTYFRNVVFVNHEWREVSQNPFVEVANVNFRIIIQGEDIGIHTLAIRHKPSGEANQNNYTTLISWGSLGDIIRQHRLRDTSVELYSPLKANDGIFLMKFI